MFDNECVLGWVAAEKPSRSIKMRERLKAERQVSLPPGKMPGAIKASEEQECSTGGELFSPDTARRLGHSRFGRMNQEDWISPRFEVYLAAPNNKRSCPSRRLTRGYNSRPRNSARLPDFAHCRFPLATLARFLLLLLFVQESTYPLRHVYIK